MGQHHGDAASEASRPGGRRRVLVTAVLLAGALVASVTAPASAASRVRTRPTGGTVGVSVTVGKPAPVAAAPVVGAGVARNPLPFDKPSTAALRKASSRLVFAHYWPPLPVSLDNQDPTRDYYQRNYLTPTGESNKHAAYGGHLRDRPIPRPTRASGDWRRVDMRTEVSQAIAAGLDGFAVCILQLEGDPDIQVWRSTQILFAAAQDVDPGFKLMLMPDMSGSMRRKTPATLAKYMAQLGANPNAHRLADGRLVVSPFQAESWTVDQWRQFLSIMRTTYRQPVAFVPLFQDERRWSAAFAPISYGMSHWGARNPQWNDPTVSANIPTSRLGRIKSIHNLGKPWMQPVSVQDARPRMSLFDEALNTTNLRTTWQLAMRGQAEWVQLTTWNDYTESTSFAPSVKHGYTFLDLNAYYLTWYKTGRAPTIVRDTVYLTHRSQFVASKPTYQQTKLMTLRGGSPARDTVEALAFLTAPALVRVRVGTTTVTCWLPAGVNACVVPLRAGTVAASVVRGRQVTTSVTSPVAVTTRPYVQDLAYVGATSGR